MVGPTGKVVGIDHIQNLVDWSENNLRKNHGNLIDSGQIKLVLGDGRLGYDQDGPYHAIHVGAAAAELPQQVRKCFIFAIFQNGRWTYYFSSLSYLRIFQSACTLKL